MLLLAVMSRKPTTEPNVVMHDVHALHLTISSTAEFPDEEPLLNCSLDGTRRTRNTWSKPYENIISKSGRFADSCGDEGLDPPLLGEVHTTTPSNNQPRNGNNSVSLKLLRFRKAMVAYSRLSTTSMLVVCHATVLLASEKLRKGRRIPTSTPVTLDHLTN